MNKANATGTTNNSTSVLGNLASVDVQVLVTPVSALYLFLIIALGSVSFFLAKKYI